MSKTKAVSKAVRAAVLERALSSPQSTRFRGVPDYAPLLEKMARTMRMMSERIDAVETELRDLKTRMRRGVR